MLSKQSTDEVKSLFHKELCKSMQNAKLSFGDEKSCDVREVYSTSDKNGRGCYIIYAQDIDNNFLMLDEDNCIELNTGLISNKKRKIGVLSSIEVKTLKCLVEYKGLCLSRDELHEMMYQEVREPLCRRVDNLISNLRKKIEPSRGINKFLLTIRNKGYMLNCL